MLICPKCNHDNELGRIFCHQCGQKLDINQIKPPSRGGKSLRKKSEFSAGKAISWILRLAVLGALVWVVYLVAQVPDVKSIETTNADLISFFKKRDAIENAVATKHEISLSFTQTELNKYIDTFKLEKPEGKGLVMSVSNLQVELEKDEATAIVVGKVSVGTSWEKNLYISYTGTPGVEDGKFTFNPVTAHIGALKVPVFLLQRTTFVQSWFNQLFGQLKDEKRLLDSATSVTSDTQALIVTYKPAATKP
jgi:hypothetical protein